MRLHRAVILVLRIPIAREEMRLPERKKALAGLQWSRVQILRKHPELFYASNHAFCYALRILMNVPLLLGFTFVLGLGAILANPAWQAVNTELVPPDELPEAVTLSSVSYNLARAVGPAVAGLIIAVAGPAAVFLLNAIAFLYVVVVLSRWHPAQQRSILPAERLTSAVRTGLRFVQHSPAMQIVLIRTFIFIFFISALWALLPVIVSHELHPGSFGYGLAPPVLCLYM